MLYTTGQLSLGAGTTDSLCCNNRGWRAAAPGLQQGKPLQQEAQQSTGSSPPWLQPEKACTRRQRPRAAEVDNDFLKEGKKTGFIGEIIDSRAEARRCQRSLLHFAVCRRARGAPLGAHRVKNLPAAQETRVRSLGWEDPLEEDMATHSSVLAWRTPWTEEPVHGGTIHGVAKRRTRLSDKHSPAQRSKKALRRSGLCARARSRLERPLQPMCGNAGCIKDGACNRLSYVKYVQI